jgi:hypothetical protein
MTALHQLLGFDRLHSATDGRGRRDVFLDGSPVLDVVAAFDGGNGEGWVEATVRDAEGKITLDLRLKEIVTEIRTGMVRVVPVREDAE